MNFYTNTHPYYCGIDLHARLLYVCIIDDKSEVLVHKKIKDSPEQLLTLLTPYLGNIVVGVECMHCWYWVSDLCRQHAIDFVLGHALYMKAIHGGKTKNDKIDSFKIAKLLRGGNFPLAYNYPNELRATRDLIRRRTKLVRFGADLKAHVSNTVSQYNYRPHSLNLRYPASRDKMTDVFDDISVQRNVDIDLNMVGHIETELRQVEWFIEKQAKQHNARDYYLLKSITGVGQILALTILYEIGDISRFDSVQKFASYSRLVKCKAESAGKTYGTQGNKIGNAHLKWAFSEMAVLYLRGNDKARAYLNQLQKRMSKAKALSALAHKLGRCVYFMLKRQKVFDEKRFLVG
ncbi:IS110 family transposase [Aliiglaciecola sp. SL4]|uniref:IS110 family transposase n=1 Tax=Aliiglaciecola sp. SL4 TaxID=3239806 RepID=UPI00355B7ED2